MAYIDVWTQTVMASLQRIWLTIMGVVPDLIGAFFVLLIGTFIAGSVGAIVIRIVKQLKVDELFDKLGLSKQLKKIGLSFKFSYLIGGLARWFVLLGVFMAVADILGWYQINEFLKTVVFYLPNVFIALAILAFGFIIAQLVHRMVLGSTEATKLVSSSAGFLAALAKVAIVIFAIMAALIQLGIAKTLIETLFASMVMGVALALGLAFGLGGKDAAKDFIDKFFRK